MCNTFADRFFVATLYTSDGDQTMRYNDEVRVVSNTILSGNCPFATAADVILPVSRSMHLSSHESKKCMEKCYARTVYAAITHTKSKF